MRRLRTVRSRRPNTGSEASSASRKRRRLRSAREGDPRGGLATLLVDEGEVDNQRARRNRHGRGGGAADALARTAEHQLVALADAGNGATHRPRFVALGLVVVADRTGEGLLGHVGDVAAALVFGALAAGREHDLAGDG